MSIESQTWFLSPNCSLECSGKKKVYTFRMAQKNTDHMTVGLPDVSRCHRDAGDTCDVIGASTLSLSHAQEEVSILFVR